MGTFKRNDDEEMQIVVADDETILNPSKKPIPYVTALGLSPKVYTNSNNLINLPDGQYQQPLQKYDANGNLYASGTFTVSSRYKLRPVDDEVFLAILQLFEDHEKFEVDLPPIGDSNYNNLLEAAIAEARVMHNVYLDDICKILNYKTIQTNNRETVLKSLELQKAIVLTSKITTTDTGEIEDSESYNLIDRFSFTKQTMDQPGRLELSSYVVEKILLGETTALHLSEYLKIPRGRARNYFKYLHAIFSDKDRVSVDQDYLFFDVIGYSKTPSQQRKHRSHFRTQSETFEISNVIQPGWSLPKKDRVYELFRKDPDTDLPYIDLRRGSYFTNPDERTLPKLNTVEKQSIYNDLSKLIGLSPKYAHFYINAINGKITAPPIEEKSHVGEGRIIKKRMMVYERGGVVIDYPNGEKPKEVYPFDIAQLRTLIDFSVLYIKYSPNKKPAQTEAIIFRNSAEKGEFYSAKLFEELKAIEKKVKDDLANEKKTKTKAQYQKHLDEIKQKEKRSNIEKEAEVDKLFTKVSNPFKMSFDAQVLARASIIEAIEKRKKIRDTWFAPTRTHFYDINQELIIVVFSDLAHDHINKKYLNALNTAAKSRGYNCLQVLTRQGFIDQYSEASRVVEPLDIVSLDNDVVAVTQVPDNQVEIINDGSPNEPLIQSEFPIDHVDHEENKAVDVLWGKIITHYSKSIYKQFIMFSIDYPEYEGLIKECLSRDEILNEEKFKSFVLDHENLISSELSL